jgi:hypothetical protein
MGPQLLEGETTTGPDGFTDMKLYASAEREPLCPRSMKEVEIVDEVYYRIDTDRNADGITHTAFGLGSPTGPYTVDNYGRPL